MPKFSRLSHRRDIDPEDFHPCVDFFDNVGEFPRGSPERQKLFDLWKCLFENHVAQGGIVDGFIEGTSGEREIVGFGMTCWVSKSFAGLAETPALRRDPRSLTRWLIDCESRQKFIVQSRGGMNKKSAGTRYPELDDLYLFVLHLHFNSTTLSAEHQMELSGMDFDAIKELHSGFPIRKFFHETRDPHMRHELKVDFSYLECERKQCGSWLMTKSRARILEIYEEKVKKAEKEYEEYILKVRNLNNQKHVAPLPPVPFYDVASPLDALFFPPSHMFPFRLRQIEKDLIFCLSQGLTMDQTVQLLWKDPIHVESAKSTLNNLRSRLWKWLKSTEGQGYPEFEKLFQEAKRRDGKLYDGDFTIKLARLLNTHQAKLRPSPYLRADKWRSAIYQET